tara:strand:+ start:44 stop:337 length:294 start_codon:yes stop_codon:yes gene_type:complete
MLKKNFTKKEIINKVYQNLGFSKNSSSIIIDDFFEFIVSELKKLNKVKISSFGTFVIANKNERIGRNPKTKIETKITARRVVKFRSSMAIKKKLNNQ